VTRQRKLSPTDLEREYLYSDPPLSFSELAEKHGVARSAIATLAAKGKWFDRREEFRSRLTERTREALSEEWSALQTANYRRLMKMASNYLDKFETLLDGDDFRPNTKDALAMASMMLQLHRDMERKPVADPTVIDGDEIEDPAAVIAEVRRLMAGEPKDEDA